MDIKSKKFRHSLFVKLLCVIASSALIFQSAYFAVAVIMDFNFYGSLDTIGKKDLKFEDTQAFNNIARQDISYAASLACASYVDIDAIDKEISAHKGKEVGAAHEKYLLKKASIIEGELYYVATHYDSYDDDRYNEDYSRYVAEPDTITTAASGDAATTFSVPNTNTTTASKDAATTFSELYTAEQHVPETSGAQTYQSIEVDSFAPKNVQIAQSILKKTSGIGFLEYEGLVRNQAFVEQYFRFDSSFELSNGDTFYWGMNGSITYDKSESGSLNAIAAYYDQGRDNFTSSIRDQKNYALFYLEKSVNFKYAAFDASGIVLASNIDNAEKALSDIKNRECFMLYEGGKLETNGFADKDSTDGYSIKNILSSSIGIKEITLMAYIENPLAKGDMYYSLSRYHSGNTGGNASRKIITAAISLAAAVLLLIVLLCLCGHKNGIEGHSLSFIDRVPGDAHLIVSAILSLSLAVLAVYVAEMTVSFAGGYSWNAHIYIERLWSELEVSKWPLVGVAALIAAVWMIITEWLASVVRTVKAGKPYFKGFVVVKLVLLLFRAFKRCFRLLSAAFKKLRYVLSRDSKKTRRTVIAFFVLYLLVNIISALMLAAGHGVFMLGFLLIASVNAFALWKSLRYYKYLDEIIKAAGLESSKIPNDPKMPESLKSLAGNIELKQDELKAAIEKAVKDERTKTELITNVSHDLKTPLTAVISYVDLLKKCDISDKTAIGYINVLEEKSTKLKLLIEDLIEASKISTGNVSLNPVSVNLTELAVQAIGEMNELFEENELEIRLSEPKEPPVIFADSQKTFRIIDNLLNNAGKYSVHGSRVYITVSSSGDYGLFEVKNISREPLNISPEELLERFVRGDKSRTNDGNGLGLSIAENLCSLQNGKLVISIDGDLFKASVYLPLENKFGFN